MSDEERTSLLRRADKERICGAYFLRLSSGMVTPARPLSATESSRVKQAGIAALSAAALALAAGCVTPSEQKKIDVPAQPSARAQAAPDVKAKPEDDEIVLFGGIVAPFEVKGDDAKH